MIAGNQNNDVGMVSNSIMLTITFVKISQLVQESNGGTQRWHHNLINTLFFPKKESKLNM